MRACTSRIRRGARISGTRSRKYRSTSPSIVGTAKDRKSTPRLDQAEGRDLLEVVQVVAAMGMLAGDGLRTGR
jgi:hypothetical protein